MNDFSIEAAEDKIVDPRTRNYFREVSSSYSAGNYRSAVVMLWSVVICDLLFKLDQVASAYNDTTAAGILKEISKKRTSKNPEWEGILLDQVKERTQLFDESEYLNLKTLQQHRHLSAHPVLTGVEALFSPNQETARAHIRNALEAILLKPAVTTIRVFDAFLEDIERMQALLPDEESLQSYLKAKYFPHFGHGVEESIFRSLWRLVFKNTDSRCESNRLINARALDLLYRRDVSKRNHQIREHSAYFSEVTLKGSCLDGLVSFLEGHSLVFGLLQDSVKVPIRNYCLSTIDRFATAWFLSDSFSDHLSKACAAIIEKKKQSEPISGLAFRRLAEAAKTEGMLPRVMFIAATFYREAGNFDEADRIFAEMVRPNLPDLGKSELIELLEAVEANTQTYWRGRSKVDHSELETYASKALGADFREKYPHFVESLREDEAA